MNSDNFLAMFDFILLAFGVYTFFSGMKMKRDGEISRILMVDSEAQKISDKKGFIDEIWGKMMVFAGIITLYGACALIDDLVVPIPMMQVIGIIIFLIVLVWFLYSLMKTKKKYMY